MNPQIPNAATLWLVSPEITLALTIAAVLIAPMFSRQRLRACSAVAAVGLVIAGLLVFFTLTRLPYDPAAVFGGMLVIDPFSQFFKLLLIASSLTTVGIWLFGGRHESIANSAPDFLCLVLGATLGMSLMSSSNNLLMIYIAIETASIPSYALAGFRREQHRSAEGALKYVLVGSAGSAIGLYGMSMIYGLTGTLSLPQIGHMIAGSSSVSPLLAAALLIGLAGPVFKLAAFPLHFWCPDVFEVAPTPVAAFLSVASKSAAVCLVVRVLITLSSPAIAHGAIFIAILGFLTCSWGNLLAMRQDRIKRLLAFSAMAHAGYIVMVASILLITGQGTADTIPGSILFYLFVYALMNFGAFAVISLLEQTTPAIGLRDLAGLGKRSPGIALLLSIFLLGLMGLPGLGGFIAKVTLLRSALVPYPGLIGIGVVAGVLLNTVAGLYAYLRPIYQMTLVDSEPSAPTPALHPALILIATACAIGLIWTGTIPDRALNIASDFGAVRTAIKPAEFRKQTLAQPLLPVIDQSRQDQSRQDQSRP